MRERESRREKKEKGKREVCCLATAYFYLVFFILDEINDVHKSINPPRLSFSISLPSFAQLETGDSDELDGSTDASQSGNSRICAGRSALALFVAIVCVKSSEI